MFAILFAGGVIAAPTLPAFSFRDIVAGSPATTDNLTWCRKELDGTTSCRNSVDKVAGIDTESKTVLYNGMLYTLRLRFGSSDYEKVLAAFRARYGEPCVTSTNKVQNGFGASFDSAHTEWCFATGKLTLDQYFEDLRITRAGYVDETNVPPAAKPKVDF